MEIRFSGIYFKPQIIDSCVRFKSEKQYSKGTNSVFLHTSDVSLQDYSAQWTVSWKIPVHFLDKIKMAWFLQTPLKGFEEKYVIVKWAYKYVTYYIFISSLDLHTYIYILYTHLYTALSGIGL